MKIAAVSLLALTLATAAQAAPTPYAGCSTPSSPGRTWYVSVTGNDVTGDGSEARPWTPKSLFAAGAWGSPRLNTYPYSRSVGGVYVTTPNAAAPVHPGDTILLESGVYPAIKVGVYGVAVSNTDWLTFMPAPGADVTLGGVAVSNTVNKLRFTGFKIRNDGTSTAALVSAVGGATDIMFDANDIAVVEDEVSLAWTTTAQWESSVTRQGIAFDSRTGASCLTAAGNKIHNVGTGMGATGVSAPAKVVLADNEVYFTTRDFIGFGATNIDILRNFLHDTQITSSSHQDCIQGGGPSMDGTAYQYTNGKFSHVVIDANRCYRQIDPRSKFSVYIQGIDAFDSDWTDVRITRNVVVTSSCHALSWGSTHYGLFARNTAVWDGSPGVTSGVSNCEPEMDPFTATHEYPLGDHIVVVDNIAPTAGFGVAMTASAAAGNLIFKAPVSTWTGSKIVYNNAPGVYGFGQLLAVDAPNNVFVNLGRSVAGYGPFDFHLAANSPASGVGVTSLPELTVIQATYPALQIPDTDIEGRPYSLLAPEAGAYAANICR